MNPFIEKILQVSQNPAQLPVAIHELSRQDRCDEVFALYQKDSGTLDFMPRGAFEEGITKGTLLVATDCNSVSVDVH